MTDPDTLRADVNDALARWRAPYDPTDLDDDTDNPEADFLFERGDNLADRVIAFLAALDAADPCEHDDGSTTYLRGDIFEDTCDTCGEILTARSLAQIEAATPGFAAATARVGETSLPTPAGPVPAPIDEED